VYLHCRCCSSWSSVCLSVPARIIQPLHAAAGVGPSRQPGDVGGLLHGWQPGDVGGLLHGWQAGGQQLL